jgi:putative ABC transport system permease protein
VEGQPAPEGGRDVIGYNAISPNYFGLTGTPFVEGRPFDGEDLDSAVVSASLARRIAPSGTALDRRFRLDPKAPWRRVIGVVGDVKVPRPGGVEGLGGQVMYVPFEPTYPEAWILLRTTGQPAGLQAILRTELEAVDPGIKLLDVRAAGTAAVEAQALPRFIAGILTTFAVLAVLMSSIGLYGVIAYTVTRRWREIGIRISLGARAAEVLMPVMANGLALTAMGLIIGLVAAYLTTGVLRGLLFAIQPFDAATFAMAAVVVTAVAVVAVFVPAHRATRMDPIAALRE